MGEKQEKRLSSGATTLLWITFILLVVLLILGGIIFCQKVKKPNDSESTEGTSSTKTIIETNDKLDEITAKTLIEKCLNFRASKESSTDEFLISLHLVDALEVDNSQSIEGDGETLYKTNIKYNDYKNKLLTYMSSNYFASYFSKNYVEKDGYLYYPAGLGASGYSYEVTDISLVSQANDKYVYEINYIVDDSVGEVDEMGITNTESYTATIIKENNKFVLDDCK